MYGVKKIVTACPHCFNTLKNEYPALGGDYDLSKRTRLYFGVGQISNKNGSQYVLGTGTAQAPATLVGSASGSSRNIYMGVRHNF